MGLTVASVANPQGKNTDFTIGPFKARVVNITFDNSYLTTGEVLTKQMMGWAYLFGAIQLTSGVKNAAGTLSNNVVIQRNASGSQLAFIAQETAGVVDTPFKEVNSGDNLSAYSGEFLILGW